MEEKAHAEFSASGSERWLNCPGSIRLCKGIEPPPPHPAAVEGTLAHECLEYLLKSKDSPLTARQKLSKNKKYNPIMIDDAFTTFLYIRKATPKNALRLVEEKCDASHFTCAGQFGTVDCAVIMEFDTIKVKDFKYGKKVVHPENNTQLIYYALAIGYKFHYNFANVEISVLQPRAPYGGEIFRSWKLPIAQLIEWEEVFREGVKRAKSKNAPLQSGKWCFFCPANNICPAYESGAMNKAQDDFAL